MRFFLMSGMLLLTFVACAEADLETNEPGDGGADGDSDTPKAPLPEHVDNAVLDRAFLDGEDALPEALSATASLGIGEDEGHFNSSHYRLGDFNGDGKVDVLYYYNDGGAWTAEVFVLTYGTLQKQRWATRQGGFWSDQQWYVGDFNGDGRDDVLKYWNENEHWTCDVHLSTGSGFEMHRWATGQGGFWSAQKWFVGDFNGDGKDDIAKYWNDNNHWTCDVHLSTGSGFEMHRWATGQGGFWDSQKWFVGDFNGDGRDDVLKYWNENNLWTCDVHISNGGGFEMQRWATGQGGYWDSQEWRIGDFNGDGKDDIAKYWNENNNWTCDVHISTGSVFVMQRWATEQGGFWDTQKWFAADFNADGKDDFMNYFFDGSGAWYADAHFSNGSAFVIQRMMTANPNKDRVSSDRKKWFVGDFANDDYMDTIHINDLYGRIFKTYQAAMAILDYPLHLPDLVGVDIGFYLNGVRVTAKDSAGRYILKAGTTYVIKATVQNIGVGTIPETESYINVKWFEHGNYYNANSGFKGLEVSEVKQIPIPSDPTAITIRHITPYFVSTVGIEVDSFNIIPESNENNNYFEVGIYIVP